jgi:hypothetical protein
MFKFQDPNGSSILEKIAAWIVFNLVSKSSVARRQLVDAAEVSDFAYFTRKSFGRANYVFRRESIYREIYKKIADKNEAIFFEFGVAYGYSTNWWIHKLSKSEVNFYYYGFDTFFGLPRDWRELKKGAFSTQGKLPNLSHPRLSFIVGEIQYSLPPTLLEIDLLIPKVILFDFDLFEPSFLAYQMLKDSLLPGDILYFDEARDADERNLIQNYLLKDFSVTVIATSYSNIAFMIT